MIKQLIRRRQPFVCLDFANDRLSVIEVTEGTVTRWCSHPLVEDVLRNGSPADVGALGEVVRRVLTAAGIGARQARLALPDEATVSRLLVLPAMPRRDLVRAMHFAAEKHIPFPLDRARWSWDVIDRTPAQVSVYLVATWRDVVDQYAAVARTAGLEPEVLEPRAIAVARALNYDQAVVLDAGGRRLHVTLLVDGHPAFADGVVTDDGATDRRDAIDRLLQRAYRHKSTVPDAAGRTAPVLLAGDLEVSELQLPVEGLPVGQVLNGQLPPVPPGFRAGGYLANLGLSIRTARWM